MTSPTRPTDLRFAEQFYRFRWPLSLLLALGIALLVAVGGGRVGRFSEHLAGLGDTTNGSGVNPPLVFDPRMDVWFGSEDEVVAAFRDIEDRFVAEDYIMVTFEAPERDLGVFDREALEAIARLTQGFLRVPGVRHVRSLTSNPWIRSEEIEDEGGSERGLVISDLVEGPPSDLGDDEIVERMIAVLGAERTAARLSEERVRRVLGPDARLEDHIGEPRLLGTIVDETGATTAIQIQVLRPRVPEGLLAEAFGDGTHDANVASTLYSVQSQRAALRGIEHVLRLEQGLAIEAPGLATLRSWIESLPEDDARDALRVELDDPTRNFMADAKGTPQRKYFEYDPDGSGGFVDRSDPADPLRAGAGFAPAPSSPFEFHLGGVPLFERNFEEVGMSDAKYMGLMFLVIALVLAIVFRNLVGVAAPLAVVFGSVAAMVGWAFSIGDLFNNMTIIAPNMLTAVALADAVHLVASWAALRGQYEDRRSLIVEVLRLNALPVFLTSVTTAVGFYSLTISEMVPVKMFGYTAGLGAIVAYLLSMTFVPAILSVVPHHGKAAGGKGKNRLLMPSNWEERLTAFVLRRRAGIVATAAVLLAVSGLGLWNLRIDSDFRAMFPDDNPVMSDFNWIESRMGGVGDLEIVFEGTGSEAWSDEDNRRLAALRLRVAGLENGFDEFDPLEQGERQELARLEEREALAHAGRVAIDGAFLTEVDRFEARLRSEMADPRSPLRVITDLTSALDVLRRMHRVQYDDASYYRVPTEADVSPEMAQESLQYDEWSEEWLHMPGQTSSTLAAQYYLQYENGARPAENLATQVSMDRTRFRIQGRIIQARSEVIVAAARRIEEIAALEFPLLGARIADEANAPPGAPALKVSGKMVLFARTNRIFTVGFVKSMAIALIVITALIGLIFRSWRIAVVSIIPNVLPIMLPLSFFGLLGKPLDAPAIFVSSVALGVCVDDSIHFFTKYLRARRRGDSISSSVQYVFETAGTAITVTSFVLILGFGMLVLSDFSPNYMMGSLAASMIALAWVADILVTPAVLSYLQPESRASAAQGPAPASPEAHPAT